MTELAIYIAQLLDPIRFVLAIAVIIAIPAFFDMPNPAKRIVLFMAVLLGGLAYQVILFPNSPDVAIFTGILATLTQAGIVGAALSWWRR